MRSLSEVVRVPRDGSSVPLELGRWIADVERLHQRAHRVGPSAGTPQRKGEKDAQRAVLGVPLDALGQHADRLVDAADVAQRAAEAEQCPGALFVRDAELERAAVVRE